MNTRTAGAALIALISAPFATHAAVYKCPGADGKPVYTDQPCTGDTPAMKIRRSGFGESARSAEITLSGTTCTARFGYGTAAGYLNNNTGAAKRVRVAATFSRKGTVVDTITLPFTVPAFGRAPFSITGAPGHPDHCEYGTSWD